MIVGTRSIQNGRRLVDVWETKRFVATVVRNIVVVSMYEMTPLQFDVVATEKNYRRVAHW